MKSKLPSTRLLGQRSISSTLLFRSSNPSNNCKEDARPSLSDFLNRRLHKSSVLPKSVQGKESPFSSPVSGGNVSASIDEHINGKKRGEAEVDIVLDVAFEQLKHSRKEKQDCTDLRANGETGSSRTNEMQESRKRRNPVEGLDGKQSARKLLVVLGDDPKPNKNGKKKRFISKEQPRPIYNHYANGSGFWNCNMEGVDNEEVGCHEVWEGVGSTTLGGLEWH